MPHTPTPDQQAMLRRLAVYIADNDTQDVFIVNGYAGTGKTTAIAAVVRALAEFAINVVLLAPTGRAAKVLSNYAGRKAYTIHKKIYRQQSLINGVGQFAIGYNSDRNTVFIVDEASMIANAPTASHTFGTGRLLDDLVTFVRSGARCKLVLIGDRAQLPPVGQTVSPVYAPEEMRDYGVAAHAGLSTVVRQERESGVLYYATRLRDAIRRGRAELPDFSQPAFPDVECITGSDLIEKLSDAYDRYGDRETIVICYSNRRAFRYNMGIRSAIQFREEALTPGDRIMVVRNCYRFPDASEEIDFIANGDVAELLRIRKYEERYGCSFAEGLLRFPDYNNIEITTKLLLDALRYDAQPHLPGQEPWRSLYASVAADYEHLPTKTQRYIAVREDDYFNALHIKYAAAVTCHKAQGGQWKAVFIDCPFRPDMLLTVESLRWLYTAITRATEKLYLINFTVER